MEPSQKGFLDGLAKGQQHDPEGCQGDCSASSVAEARSREVQIDLMSVFIDAVQYQLGHGFGS